MGIKLISNKHPCGFWIGLDGLGDVRGEIGFGTRGSDAGSHDLPSGYIHIGDQLSVPCRSYSNSSRSTWPGCIGKDG